MKICLVINFFSPKNITQQVRPMKKKVVQNQQLFFSHELTLKSCPAYPPKVSPTHAPPPPKKDEQEEVAVLRLVHFTHCPKIDFGQVKLGQSRTRLLQISNPKDDVQEVRL